MSKFAFVLFLASTLVDGTLTYRCLSQRACVEMGHVGVLGDHPKLISGLVIGSSIPITFAYVKTADKKSLVAPLLFLSVIHLVAAKITHGVK